MRVPISRVYRAFPELDRFSDAECEQFVLLAKQQQRASRVIAIFIGIALAGVVVATTIGIVAFVGMSLDAVLPLSTWSLQYPLIFDLSIVLGFVGLPAALGAYAAFFVRDRWLKSAILDKLLRAKCGSCNYSLLGLSVSDDRIQCPECGTVYVLADLGMTAADFIAIAEQQGKVEPKDAAN
jgi:hypothetical protein